jgi:hypothetical protein
MHGGGSNSSGRRSTYRWSAVLVFRGGRVHLYVVPMNVNFRQLFDDNGLNFSGMQQTTKK